MNKSKLLNILGTVVTVVITVFILGFASSKTNIPVGGNFNPVPVEFSQGITVGGTEVINNTGQFTGGLNTVLASVIGSTSVGLNYYKPVVSLTADTTITAAATGTIYNVGTAGVDVTLPAPTAAKGVHYRFVVDAAFATTDVTIVSGTADLIEGSLIVAGAVVACDAADIITIAAANEDIGDFIDLYSNGVKWMIGANQAMTAGNHACSG